MTKIHSANGTNVCSSLALSKLLCIKKLYFHFQIYPIFNLNVL